MYTYVIISTLIIINVLIRNTVKICEILIKIASVLHFEFNLLNMKMKYFMDYSADSTVLIILSEFDV